MMKFLSGVVAAGFVATVGLAAQDRPTTPSTQGGADRPSTSAQASGQGKSVTISGCIQNAPAASAGASAGGAQASAGSKFVLADAKMSGGSSSSAVGTTGTASTRYQLEGEEKAISPHVNHQVEITGTLEGTSASAGASSSGSSSSGAACAGASRSASASAGPTLKVTSVKMVSATCS